MKMSLNILRCMQYTQLLQGKSPLSVNNLESIRCIAIKVVQPAAPKNESHDEKNTRLQRALSPHLTIYKYQLTSVLSITHRFTGLAMAGYAVTLGLGALVLPHDFSHYITMIEGLQMNAITLKILKAFIAFPIVYHTFNGLRHLMWDRAKFLSINEVYTTGYIMLGTSIAGTILLALL